MDSSSVGRNILRPLYSPVSAGILGLHNKMIYFIIFFYNYTINLPTFQSLYNPHHAAKITMPDCVANQISV